MDPPWGIDLMTYHTMSRQSYISLQISHMHTLCMLYYLVISNYVATYKKNNTYNICGFRISLDSLRQCNLPWGRINFKSFSSLTSNPVGYDVEWLLKYNNENYIIRFCKAKILHQSNLQPMHLVKNNGSNCNLALNALLSALYRYSFWLWIWFYHLDLCWNSVWYN